MIDQTMESVVPLAKAARIVNPANPPHIATLHRWVSVGVRGVRLESVRLGGQRYTSREGISRFLAALNSDTPGAFPEPPNRRAERAEAELLARGC